MFVDVTESWIGLNETLNAPWENPLSIRCANEKNVHEYQFMLDVSYNSMHELIHNLSFRKSLSENKW